MQFPNKLNKVNDQNIPEIQLFIIKNKRKKFIIHV